MLDTRALKMYNNRFLINAAGGAGRDTTFSSPSNRPWGPLACVYT